VQLLDVMLNVDDRMRVSQSSSVSCSLADWAIQQLMIRCENTSPSLVIWLTVLWWKTLLQSGKQEDCLAVSINHLFMAVYYLLFISIWTWYQGSVMVRRQWENCSIFSLICMY